MDEQPGVRRIDARDASRAYMMVTNALKARVGGGHGDNYLTSEEDFAIAFVLRFLEQCQEDRVRLLQENERAAALVRQQAERERKVGEPGADDANG